MAFAESTKNMHNSTDYNFAAREENINIIYRSFHKRLPIRVCMDKEVFLFLGESLFRYSAVSELY